MVGTALGALHDRDPLVVVGEEGEVEVRGGGEGLGGDGQLTQEALGGFCHASATRIDEGLFEPLVDQSGNNMFFFFLSMREIFFFKYGKECLLNDFRLTHKIFL